MKSQISNLKSQINYNEQNSNDKNKKVIWNLLFVIWCLFVICNLVFGIYVSSCFAQSLKIQDLINESKKYDGKIVEIEGEAIGHIMPRGNYAWVNINDGSNSFGVWMNKAAASKIKQLGKNAVVGDYLSINGIVNERCSQHGGEMDIHARNVIVLKKGYLVHIPLDTVKTNVLLFLVGALACLYFIKILKKQL